MNPEESGKSNLNEFKTKAKNYLKELSKKTIEERSEMTEKHVNQSLAQNNINIQFTIPFGLVSSTIDSTERFIDDWDGVDMKASEDRRKSKSSKPANKKEGKQKKVNKRDENWYKATAKSWFNQRVSEPQVFGRFWNTICLELKRVTEKEIREVFIQCLLELVSAKVDFCRTTKDQPLIQASVISKSKLMANFLKDNKICDIETIKKKGKRKFPKFGAVQVRSCVLKAIKKQLHIEINGMEGNFVNQKDSLIENYGGVRGIPINIQKFRFNPIGEKDNGSDWIDSDVEKTEVVELKQEVSQLKAEVNLLNKKLNDVFTYMKGHCVHYNYNTYFNNPPIYSNNIPHDFSSGLNNTPNQPLPASPDYSNTSIFMPPIGTASTISTFSGNMHSFN